jgi:hypothetical protein
VDRSGNRDYEEINANIAANVRAYRERPEAAMAQETLAERMAERGFPWTQALVWKVEAGRRPVRAAELVALGDVFGTGPIALTYRPEATDHLARLRAEATRAGTAYEAVRDAAAAYLEAQLGLAVTARTAHDAGLPVATFDTTWLTVTPEEAVIEARAGAPGDQDFNDQVDKVLAALRSAGYQPLLSIEDVTYEGGGDGAWTPGDPQAPPARGLPFPSRSRLSGERAALGLAGR